MSYDVNENHPHVVAFSRQTGIPSSHLGASNRLKPMQHRAFQAPQTANPWAWMAPKMLPEFGGLGHWRTPKYATGVPMPIPEFGGLGARAYAEGGMFREVGGYGAGGLGSDSKKDLLAVRQAHAAGQVSDADMATVENNFTAYQAKVAAYNAAAAPIAAAATQQAKSLIPAGLPKDQIVKWITQFVAAAVQKALGPPPTPPAPTGASGAPLKINTQSSGGGGKGTGSPISTTTLLIGGGAVVLLLLALKG